MIKYISQIIRAGLVFLAIAGFAPAIAQVTTIDLSIARDSIGEPGDTIRIPVTMVTDVAGENLIAFKLEFTQGSYLMPIGIETDGTLLEAWDDPIFYNDPGNAYFSVTGAGITPIAGPGVLFYVDFKLLNVPYGLTQQIYLKNPGTNYFNEGGYTIAAAYGSVQIVPKPVLSVSPSGSPLVRGDSSIIYVSGGTGPYTLTTSNPSVATITSSNYIKGVAQGFVTVSAEDVNGATGTSTSYEVRSFRISFAGPASSIAGDTIDIGVTLSDVSDLNVIAGKFELEFQGATILDVTKDGTLLEGFDIESSQLTASHYLFGFAGISPLATGLPLLKVRVRVHSSVNAGYVYAYARNMSFNESLLGNSLDKSFYYAGTPTPYLSGYSNLQIPGQQVQYTASAGTPPYTYSVSDPDVATIDSTGLLTVLKGGKIKVKVTDAFNQVYETALQHFMDGRISVSQHTAVKDAIYNLPVHVTAMPDGRHFSAFNFTVDYDPTYLTFIGVADTTGTIAENFSVLTNQLSASQVKIVGASQNFYGEAGMLLYLKFQLLPALAVGATTGVNLSNIIFNEGVPELTWLNGSIKASDPPPTAANVVQTMPEDSIFFFEESMFSFYQAQGKPFAAVRIDQLPAKGTLRWNNTPVTQGLIISTTGLYLLTYEPEPNESGDAYAFFKFSVNDNLNYSNLSYSFTFNVTPINDVPSFTLNGSLFERDEDFSDIISVIPDLDVIPADETSQTITWSLSPDTADFVMVDFDPANGTVDFTSIPEMYGLQEFTLTANDGEANLNQYSQTFTVIVHRFNTAPVFEAQQFDLTENALPGTIAANLVASDAENDTLSFTILSGNTSGAFEMQPGGVLVVANPEAIDYETNPFFTISVLVSDGYDSAEAPVTINLLDIDEANAPIVADQVLNVDENSTTGHLVGTLAATDPNNDPLTFTILSGNTDNAFLLNDSTGSLYVQTESALDYEATPTFTLQVSVSDGISTVFATLTVNLLDIDEGTAPSFVDQSFTIEENQPLNAVVGQLVASDIDGDELSFSIVSGNSSNAFALDPVSGQLTVNNPSVIDFEDTASFHLYVAVFDGIQSTYATVTVFLTDIDETNTPVIADQSFTIAENTAGGTTVGTVVATDPNGDALSFSVVGGNTNNAFTITPVGVLKVNNAAALNHEVLDSVALTIRVTDGTNQAFAQVGVSITNVNEAPIASDAAFTIAEMTAQGSLVGSVSVSDPDDQFFTFTIVSGNTGNAFTVNNAGEITVHTPASLNFETTPTFTLGITVNDGGLTDQATVTITLTDLNEVPEIFEQAFSVAENSAVGTTVGTVVASDPDNDALTFSIFEGNVSDAFALNSNTGVITVNNEQALDFESNNEILLSVVVSDGNVTDTATVTVNITDIAIENFPPALVNPLQDEAIDEDAGNVTLFADVLGLYNDVEGDPIAVDVMSSNNNISVSITNNQLIVSAPANYFGETTITLSATDGFSEPVTDSFELTVTSINDAPTFAINSFNVELEQDFEGTETITATADPGPDNESTQVITYSLSPASVTFANVSINAATGQISITAVAGQSGTQAFSIIANDGGAENATASVPFTLTIESVVAVENPSSPLFSFYPNPTSGRLTVALKAGDADLQIVDQSGKAVLSDKFIADGNDRTYDVSRYQNGVYFISVRTGDTMQIRKFVILK